MSDISLYLRVEDLLFPGTITLISSIQLVKFARRVGGARMKTKVAYPETSGDPVFDRAFRAQANTLEFHPIFMGCLWMSSIFGHPGISAGIGLVYIYSRHIYFEGYSKSVEKRMPGFKLGIVCLNGYLVMSVAGMLTVGLRKYTGIDLAEIASVHLRGMLPWK